MISNGWWTPLEPESCTKRLSNDFFLPPKTSSTIAVAKRNYFHIVRSVFGGDEKKLFNIVVMLTFLLLLLLLMLSLLLFIND